MRHELTNRANIPSDTNGTTTQPKPVTTVSKTILKNDNNTNNNKNNSNNSCAIKVENTKYSRLISIIAPSIAFFGCQFSWAVEDGNVSPFLRELGMSAETMSYAWLLGPISGILFQPIIGVFSDHCTSSYGKRKPFIFIGSILLSLCLIIFSNANNLTFGANNRVFPLLIAFVAFWQLDFSTNLLEGPLRALCSDTLNSEEQLASHSWFGIMNGLASTLGFGLGYMFGNIRIVFGISAIVMIISVIITSILVKEKPYVSKSPSPKSADTNESMSHILSVRLREILSGIINMPFIVQRCWYIQFCCFFGHFACWVYLCDYFGTQIMDGDPDEHHTSNSYKKYIIGVEYGNLAFMFISVINVIFSLLTTKLAVIFSLKTIWIFSLLIYAIILISSMFISHLYVALLIFSFIGIPMSTSFTIPWSIIGSYSNKYDNKRACLWTTALNIAECGPELTIALIAGYVIKFFNDKTCSVLFMAGCVNIIGAYIIFVTDFSDYTLDHSNSKSNKDSSLILLNDDNKDELQNLLNDDDDDHDDEKIAIVDNNNIDKDLINM